MKYVSIYDKYGKIVGITGIQEASYSRLAPVLPPHVMGQYPSELWYVVDGAACPRPAQNTTVDGNWLRNMPAPCTVVVDDVEFPCAETHAELVFNHKGTYTVEVRAFPYLDWKSEVSV